jgi:hypothetical protein
MPLANVLHIDALTAFGLAAVSLMLAFYALESQSRHFTLMFAGACVMGSAYGFMQGAWPFGLVEGVWSVVAIKKWSGLNVPSGTPAPDICVDAFLEDLARLAKQVGPITHAFTDDDGQPRGFVQLYRPKSGCVLIHRLWAVSPGAGTGSHMLATLCELADHHEVEIALRPLPFGPEPYPMSVEQLSRWYSRHGFCGSTKRMLRKPAPLNANSPTKHRIIAHA